MARSNYFTGVLFIFHCEEDTGYAISSIEDVFLKLGNMLSPGNIHFSYTELSQSLNHAADFSKPSNVIKFNPKTCTSHDIRLLSEYVRDNKINLVVGFDQSPRYKYYCSLRRAGVKKIISYWGAPMSDLNTGVKLLIRRLEIYLRRCSPDMYIFESKAMQNTAIFGRGIPYWKTAVVRLGVDTQVFYPRDTVYPYEVFNIPKSRRIIFYSGHMEERKGIRVLMHAAKYLYNDLGRKDFHFLILGNQPGQEKKYLAMLSNSAVSNHVTFGGYRSDVAEIMPGCYIGVIASTGWDSLTMSSVEMSASGLPLLVSNLQGLVETVEDGKTGYIFDTGDYYDLSNKISRLLDDMSLRMEMSKNSVEWVKKISTRSKQVKNLYSSII